MKTNSIYRMGYAALALILALAACNNPAGSGAPPGETIPPGMGLARISLAGGEARTAVPGEAGHYFTLEFTSPGKTTVNRALDGGVSLTLTVALEPAVWTLEVKGYTDSGMSVQKTNGRASVPIAAGTAASFEVYLTPDFSSGGMGSLDYSVSFPAGARGWLALYPLDDTPGASREIDISAGTGGTASDTLIDLPEGSYRAVIDLYNPAANTTAVWTGAAHIAGDSTTTLAQAFTAADFAGHDPVAGTGTETTLAAKLDAALSSPAGSYVITLNGTETDLNSFAPKILSVTGDKDIALTIIGNGQTVQLGSDGRLFTLGAVPGSSLTLALQDITLTGRGSNTDSLVRVESRGTLELRAGSLITGNTTSNSYGGGVYVFDNGTLHMSGGTISGNTASSAADSYGGGVYVNGGTFAMSGGAVSDNTASSSGASSYGGGVYVNGGTFAMSGGAVSDNTASSSGGGVYVNGGTFTISGGAVSDNTASSSGGGVYVNGGTFTISGGAVNNNTASYSGGGVYVASYGGTFSMSDGTVSGNTVSSSSSSGGGGGVYISYGTFAMSGGAVSGNTVSSSSSYYYGGGGGGGVYVYGGTFTMSDGTINNNTASSSSSSSYYGGDGGGGVYINDGIFAMNGGAVTGNTASSSSSSSSYGGGGVYVHSGTFTMSDGTINNNTASSSSGGGGGGGVYVSNQGGTFTMSDGTINNNTASASSSSYGGGVYVGGGGFTMSNGAVSGNTAFSSTASSYGGGVYIRYGGFTMNGGAVSGNTLSGANSFGREVYGAFWMSGDARPERVFLSNDYGAITITGPLTGGPVPIDLGITGSESLASWVGRQILRLGSSSGNLAGLKAHFTLGNVTLTESPWTETPIPAGYTIGDNGKLVPPPSSGIGGIAYSAVSGGAAWTLESDGRRKSPPIGDNSTTKARISFTSAGADAIITIALDVSSRYDDFAFVSTLDNAAATYDSGYFTNSRISGTDSVTIAIPVPTAGSHFIDIGYRKDGSYSYGSDCAWFKVVE